MIPSLKNTRYTADIYVIIFVLYKYVWLLYKKRRDLIADNLC